MWKDFSFSFANIFFIFCKYSNFPGGSEVKHLPAMRETQVWMLGQEDPLEKEMAIHSSTLAWKISWMEEPGRLQSRGLQTVGHDWATLPTATLGLLWSGGQVQKYCALSINTSYLFLEDKGLKK